MQQVVPTELRRQQIVTLAREEFDLLVVGGGITGCGIARDAVLRGLRVALVEKDDFASGTSSRSSRLVHGGLRYLEHGFLHLVFEASSERRRLLRLAPHLVRPLEFLWPVYAGARVPQWKLNAGLTLYDALALFRNVGTHRRLSVRQIAAHEPELRREGLLGGARYFDAATDDARLTLANAVGALDAGAVVLNHARVVELLLANDARRGASVHDEIGSTKIDVRAKVIVNATGPWSNELQRLGDDSTERAKVRGSKGVHIAVARGRIGNHGALTLLAPNDGRVMFILPSGRLTIIGTTDTFTDAHPDDVRASEGDVSYLLDAANAFFPAAHLTADDVVSAWAGIRPLIATGAENANPTNASREHAISQSGNGVVSITGGKLTTYRIMAAEVVDTVAEQLGTRVTRRPPTLDAPLPGGDLAYIDEAIAAAERATADSELANHLVRSYGSRWSAVVDEIAEPNGGERLAGLPYTIGEMRYAVKHEMAYTIADLLLRRTHLAFETRDHGTQSADRVARGVADLLGWNDRDIAGALESYGRDVQRVFAIDS
ncbi:MAG TPA: glycerol-3-phosphate dehydrogenase [Gemmatimonadaceae bacterium]|nr:glycerol-3-phosphate dehydrogenase [Gemmatimonadaceae bacterium]